MLDGSRSRLLLRRSRRGIRYRFADRKPHRRGLLHLVDDELLRDTPQLFVLAVAQFADRHVDRALMMRGHHSHEVPVPTSPLGLIALSFIILVIAVAFSCKNGASSTAAAGCADKLGSCASKCDGTANAIRI